MLKINSKVTKNLIFAIGMLIFIAVISAGTYLIVKNTLKPSELNTPINLSMLEDDVLAWDQVEKADGYAIKILNRTTGNITGSIHIYEAVYEVNEFNKVIYDISTYIQNDQNYSITVKAVSYTLENSDYANSYELQQIDPSNDEDPYINQDEVE
jgi:hypothetical protein